MAMRLTRTELHEVADARSWQRGIGYFLEGRVSGLLHDGETVVASVQGEFLYRVRLSRLHERLSWECSCPVGLDGDFCKHCVAVGLACAEEEEEPASGDPCSGATARRRTSTDDPADSEMHRIRQYLSGQDPTRLVEKLVVAAEDSPTLFRQLRMEAAQSGAAVDMKVMKQATTDATRTHSYVDYRESRDFARGIHAVADSVARLLEQGRASEVIELSEHALRRVERALGHMDDSGGFMRPILDDLQTLHHAACLAARPDPVRLARRLFQWEAGGDWDTFYGAVKTYADVFGDAGVAEYRRLAEAQWREVPQLGPGQEGTGYEHPRFRLTAIMEALARASSDVEALVAVMSRDLSSPYQYLGIAEAYKKAGMVEKTLAWAERGVETFPQSRDDRVREFLALEYSRLGRHHDALAIVWQTFLCSPDVPSYERLKAHADQVGEWPHWRGKAVDHLESLRDARASRPRHATSGLQPPAFPMPDYNSQLVGFYLWEQDVEAAWAEACKHGCPRWQWLDLAQVRETTHPEGSLPIYQAEVLNLVRATGGSYEEPFELVKRIRA
ncbi:MAG: DUF6880 family protein, partial [bacterium]